MSLVTQITDLATRIATEFNTHKSRMGNLASLTTTDKSSLVAAINEVDGSSGGGATNLAATLSATNTIITSDTGTDATIPAADGTNAGVMTSAMYTKLNGIATGADVTSATNVGSSINGATAKSSAVDADTLALIDSEASNVLKKITIANFKNVMIAAIGAGAPATLDTIDEIAAALGDDPNAITTITTALSNRVRVDINNQGLTGTQQTNARTNIAAAGSVEVGDTTRNFVTDFESGLV